MATALLVDDEPGVLFTLKSVLQSRGHRTVTCGSGAEALTHLNGVDVVVTDLAMPQVDGLEVLRQVRDRDASLPVILLTAHGSEKVAVNAMKSGAYDYMAKPFDIDELAMVVERAFEARSLRVSNRRLAAEQALGQRIIGRGPAMARLLEAVERVATREVTVLVRGETGTGKELVSSLLHAHSARHDKPLVRFNCAAIPGELAEAELFGHAKGAFTGAERARRGFFVEAHGGTLVLDEVGELPLAIQAKLLRALQEGEIQPVGSGRTEKVDVRIVAATNRDLAAEARAGRFREDLYYRLAVVELVVPPLREHREDIPELALEFARRYGDKFSLGKLSLASSLLERLQTADWPGNVRQLENTIARLAALSSSSVLDASSLDDANSSNTSASPHSGAAPAEDAGSVADGPSFREQVEAFERNLVARALTQAHGNQSEAARRLRLGRVTLIDKMKKYELS